jgi:hypothetical protein
MITREQRDTIRKGDWVAFKDRNFIGNPTEYHGTFLRNAGGPSQTWIVSDRNGVVHAVPAKDVIRTLRGLTSTRDRGTLEG